MLYSETVIYGFCNFICSICIGVIKDPLTVLFSLFPPIWKMIKITLDIFVQVNTVAHVCISQLWNAASIWNSDLEKRNEIDE
jgi:hypothetical protein